MKYGWTVTVTGVIQINGSSDERVRSFIEESNPFLPQSAFRIVEGDNPFVFQ